MYKHQIRPQQRNPFNAGGQLDNNLRIKLQGYRARVEWKAERSLRARRASITEVPRHGEDDGLFKITGYSRPPEHDRDTKSVYSKFHLATCSSSKITLQCLIAI
jgi:hypothetical protein